MTPTRIYRSSKSAQNRRPEPADMGGSVMSHELAGHAIRFGDPASAGSPRSSRRVIALHSSSGAHLALISSPVLGVFAVLEDLGPGCLSELLLVQSVIGCQDRGAFVGDESEPLFWPE